MSVSVGLLSALERRVPDKFHQQQYYIASVLFIICLALYTFGPSTKSETLAALAAAFGGFVTGKFTNGFKKPGDNPGPSEQKGNTP